jgi:hypothetical protein
MDSLFVEQNNYPPPSRAWPTGCRHQGDRPEARKFGLRGHLVNRQKERLQLERLVPSAKNLFFFFYIAFFILILRSMTIIWEGTIVNSVSKKKPRYKKPIALLLGEAAKGSGECNAGSAQYPIVRNDCTMTVTFCVDGFSDQI